MKYREGRTGAQFLAFDEVVLLAKHSVALALFPVKSRGYGAPVLVVHIVQCVHDHNWVKAVILDG